MMNLNPRAGFITKISILVAVLMLSICLYNVRLATAYFNPYPTCPTTLPTDYVSKAKAAITAAGGSIDLNSYNHPAMLAKRNGNSNTFLVMATYNLQLRIRDDTNMRPLSYWYNSSGSSIDYYNVVFNPAGDVVTTQKIAVANGTNTLSEGFSGDGCIAAIRNAQYDVQGYPPINNLWPAFTGITWNGTQVYTAPVTPAPSGGGSSSSYTGPTMAEIRNMAHHYAVSAVALALSIAIGFWFVRLFYRTSND